MAWIRTRTRKTGTYYYVVAAGRTFAAGQNRQVATRIRNRYDELERLDRHGIASPSKSNWRLSDLKKRDIAANPESSRVRRWRQLEAWFGADLLIDEITHAMIEQYRRRGAGPATINRDLSVLSSALATARRLHDLSGYMQNPFDGLPRLDEKRVRRRSPRQGRAS